MTCMASVMAIVAFCFELSWLIMHRQSSCVVQTLWGSAQTSWGQRWLQELRTCSQTCTSDCQPPTLSSWQFSQRCVVDTPIALHSCRTSAVLQLASCRPCQYYYYITTFFQSSWTRHVKQHLNYCSPVFSVLALPPPVIWMPNSIKVISCQYP